MRRDGRRRRNLAAEESGADDTEHPRYQVSARSSPEVPACHLPVSAPAAADSADPPMVRRDWAPDFPLVVRTEAPKAWRPTWDYLCRAARTFAMLEKPAGNPSGQVMERSADSLSTPAGNSRLVPCAELAGADADHGDLH